MENLHDQNCEACRVGAPLVAANVQKELSASIPEWKIIKDGDVEKLRRIFEFADFASALQFTQQVGEIAEQEDHHPLIVTEWGKVTVYWWSHKIKGLHKNDFIMAAKTDQLYK